MKFQSLTIAGLIDDLSEEEIDQLVRAAQGTAELIARFCADGKAGDLNSYLVLTRS